MFTLVLAQITRCVERMMFEAETRRRGRRDTGGRRSHSPGNSRPPNAERYDRKRDADLASRPISQNNAL